jgi:hypothetical protein
MREFIEELKYNKKINEEKGLENRVDVDYVIERLENIQKNTNVLEDALIDEIDMVLDCNFENEIDLEENVKRQIAKDIIDFEDGIWEDLHIIVLERLKNEFIKKLKYLEEKSKVCELDKEELYDYETLKEWYE